MDGYMQACTDIDELMQLWKREEQRGTPTSCIEKGSNRKITFCSFQMSSALSIQYKKCCRYLSHDNLEMAMQMLPMCSHCADPLPSDQQICSETKKEFFLCNACYLHCKQVEKHNATEDSEDEVVPELVTEDDLPATTTDGKEHLFNTATTMELSNILIEAWQTEEVQGEETVLEFPQGPMRIRSFHISQSLASLYAQCLQHGVPNLPHCVIPTCQYSATFNTKELLATKDVPIHSAYNTGFEFCLCNDCFIKMVGEEPEEYYTEGVYTDLDVKLRQPDANLIRISDDLLAPISQDPYDYDPPMLELHGILRSFFDRGNSIIIEPREGIFSICKTLHKVFGCDWSGFSCTTGENYCFPECANKYFNSKLVSKYTPKTNYTKSHRITCPTKEAAWVDGYLFEYDEEDHEPEREADDGIKIIFDQNEIKGTTSGVSVAVHVGENGGKLIWMGNNRGEREEYIQDLTETANREKRANRAKRAKNAKEKKGSSDSSGSSGSSSGSGETKLNGDLNEKKEDEVQRFLRLHKLEMYYDQLMKEGYDCLLNLKNVKLVDLIDDIGMKKGHARRLLVEIEKIL